VGGRSDQRYRGESFLMTTASSEGSLPRFISLTEPFLFTTRSVGPFFTSLNSPHPVVQTCTLADHDSRWIYSISTEFATGSLGRQVSWIYLTAMTIPGVILVRFLRSDSRPSIKEGYEAVPLVKRAETTATRLNFEENDDIIER